MTDEQFQVVDVPGHGEVEFPASMSDADVVAAVQKLTAATTPPVKDRAYYLQPEHLMERPQTESGIPEAIAGLVASGLATGPALGAIGGGIGRLLTMAKGTKAAAVAGPVAAELAQRIPYVGPAIKAGRVAARGFAAARAPLVNPAAALAAPEAAGTGFLRSTAGRAVLSPQEFADQQRILELARAAAKREGMFSAAGWRAP